MLLGCYCWWIRYKRKLVLFLFLKIFFQSGLVLLASVSSWKRIAHSVFKKSSEGMEVFELILSSKVVDGLSSYI